MTQKESGQDIMENNELYFSLEDELLDEQVGLDNLSLPILKEFVEQVATFIKGGDRIDLNQVKIAIKPGSVVIAAQNSPYIAPAVAEYRTIKQNGSLAGISPIRAKVIADLQEKVSKNPNRSYMISDNKDATSIQSSSITVSNASDYKMMDEDQWIETEAYLYGRVNSLGGKSKSNIHIELENGNTIILDTDTETLEQDTENRVYKNQLVRVKAERNLQTKELRNERLVSFENYHPHHDEDEFQAIVARTRKAWADVPDVVAWVNDLRGSYA
ncbi:hypothetical protein FWF89_00100 [Candidatus Saccharibacteria bacterium]|nr:hypothetical protein [Candidatus Saccharibacteria bacterium]